MPIAEKKKTETPMLKAVSPSDAKDVLDAGHPRIQVQKQRSAQRTTMRRSIAATARPRFKTPAPPGKTGQS